ncbi:MAG: hypothetical protein PHS38_08655 [Bacteroidales bacterium]|jgi:hypothetical protein|nr:hypothetical protein [Clostridia bacterium]MDD3944769.1 hypothetical protein [Bacteroidales bacterium]
MTYFDDKQKKVIRSWHDLAKRSENPYMAFMSEWIAFNAICYNLYYEKAVIDRANIDRSRSKLDRIRERLINNSKVVAENAILNRSSDKLNLDLSFPERLFISVSDNNYTEDIIFNEYVKDNQEWYNINPSDSFNSLKESLLKREFNRYYVINMAKNKQYKNMTQTHDFSKLVDEMARKNIIVLCENNDLKTIKNVLYQIRCNIFHGEKTPGYINDDRIVKSASPLLQFIVEEMIHKHRIVNSFNH